MWPHVIDRPYHLIHKSKAKLFLFGPKNRRCPPLFNLDEMQKYTPWSLDGTHKHWQPQQQHRAIPWICEHFKHKTHRMLVPECTLSYMFFFFATFGKGKSAHSVRWTHTHTRIERGCPVHVPRSVGGLDGPGPEPGAFRSDNNATTTMLYKM